MKLLRSLFLLLAVTLSLNAQVAGRVTGTVVDSTGAAVPDAEVSLNLPGSASPAFTTKTSTAGDFTLLSVPANSYDLVVQAKGFQKAVVAGVRVETARATDVPTVKLEVSGLTQTVEVTEATTGVQTSNAEVSTTIAKSQIASLPVLNRSPLGFLLTQAGINYSAGSTTINGQRPTYVNVTIDGMNIQDNFIRTNDMDFLPNLLLLDQVAEVTVSSSNANSSSYGGSSQVAFVTPSGTNSFHGNGYWSNRNNYFAANTWFNNRSGTQIPFLNQNQLGGSIGGHIITNKLFFYSELRGLPPAPADPHKHHDSHHGCAQRHLHLPGERPALQKVNVLSGRWGSKLGPHGCGNHGQGSGRQRRSITSTLAIPALRLRSQYGGLCSSYTRNNRTRDNFTIKGDYILHRRHSFTVTHLRNRDLLDRPDHGHYVQPASPRCTNNGTTKMMSFAWRLNPTSTLTNEVALRLQLRRPRSSWPAQEIPKLLYHGPLSPTRSTPSVPRAATRTPSTRR